MSFTSITDEELVNMGVTGLDDTPELSTEEMQAQFDEYPRFLKDKFRTHITEEEANTAAGNIGATIPEELTNVTTEKVQPILNELASRAGSQASTITSHLADTSNPHSVTKAQVGLGNCDNTSDLNKPISTATQTALNGKAPTNHASSSDTYGKSTSSNFGHSKLTDTYKSNNPSDIKSANDGIGASQKGLNDAYKDLLGMIESAGHGDMLKENYDPNGDYIIDIAQGGTNANTAAQARTNLGLGSVATENTVPVSKGGSGLTSSPSMLTNLGSTSADTIMKASPRPGVTGTLPIANGGTGQTTAAGVRNALGLGNTTAALPVANGGTGLTSQPSMLTNLGSTSADTIMKASPRPGVTGTLPVSNGGTGLTSQPSMLTNLGSTSADTIMKASPRPGVTGTLPLANGGTGATDAETARANLHVPTTDKVSDNAPYLLRKGKGNLVDLVLEGYSLPVNQLLIKTTATTTTGGVTFTNNGDGSWTLTGTPSSSNVFYNLDYAAGSKKYLKGHKYYVSVSSSNNKIGAAIASNSGSISYAFGSGAVVDFEPNDDYTASWCRLQVANLANENIGTVKMIPMIFDLTQMFGTDIANRIYSKEQASAGSGIAWIKSYGFFSKDYEPFNLGSIQSVKTSGRKVVGFNQFTKSGLTEHAALKADGTLQINQSYDRSVSDYIKALPNTEYYCMNLVPATLARQVACYNSNKDFLAIVGLSDVNAKSGVITTVNETAYVRIGFPIADTDNVCLNISDTTKNGTYEPYTSTTVALPNEDLRGILKRDGDNLYAYGDTDIGIGNKNVRFGYQNLGDLEWIYTTSGSVFAPFFQASFTDIKSQGSPISNKANIICAKYLTTKRGEGDFVDKCICADGTATALTLIQIKDSAYTDAATFKAAMNGVYLVHEKLTPTTETSTPWQNPQRSFTDGTEQFIDDRDVPLPVGNTSVYQLNETLPPIEDYVDEAISIHETNPTPVQIVENTYDESTGNFSTWQDLLYELATGGNFNTTTPYKTLRIIEHFLNTTYWCIYYATLKEYDLDDATRKIISAIYEYTIIDSSRTVINQLTISTTKANCSYKALKRDNTSGTITLDDMSLSQSSIERMIEMYP